MLFLGGSFGCSDCRRRRQESSVAAAGELSARQRHSRELLPSSFSPCLWRSRPGFSSDSLPLYRRREPICNKAFAKADEARPVARSHLRLRNVLVVSEVSLAVRTADRRGLDAAQFREPSANRSGLSDAACPDGRYFTARAHYTKLATHAARFSDQLVRT